jgi:hypothetical protein
MTAEDDNLVATSIDPPMMASRAELDAMLEANKKSEERRNLLEQQLAFSEAQCVAEKKKVAVLRVLVCTHCATVPQT